MDECDSEVLDNIVEADKEVASLVSSVDCPVDEGNWVRGIESKVEQECRVFPKDYQMLVAGVDKMG